MLGCYAILFVDVDSTSIHKMRHGYSTVRKSDVVPEVEMTELVINRFQKMRQRN